jgi:hypothetical protein
VSLVVARNEPAAPAREVVAGSFNASSTASVRDAAHPADKRANARKPAAGAAAAGAGAAAGATPNPGDAGGSATGAADPSGSTPAATHAHPDTAAAGNAAPADASADGVTKIPVHAAKAGEWQLDVESRVDGALLGDASGSATLYADEPQTDGAEQRFVPRGRPLGMFAASTVRTPAQGRYLAVLELTGEPGRRLLGAAPVSDVPSSWRVGDRWTWRLVAEDKRTTLDAALTLVGRETLTLKDGKTQVEVVRVDQAMTLAGDRSENVARKVWFAPSLGVPVRIEEHVTGTDTAGRAVDRQTTADLTSTEPTTASIVPDQPSG